jgi:hypothetical protein
MEVSVTVRAGRTRIAVMENLSQKLGAIFGGICGGMGGGGFGVMSGIIAGVLNTPLALVVALPAWLLITYGTARTVYGRSSRRRSASWRCWRTIWL